MRTLLRLFILGVILVFFLAGCAVLKSALQVEKPYRTVVASDGMLYNIPTDFPNPFSIEDMANFRGKISSISTHMFGVTYWKVNAEGEIVDESLYGLVLDSDTELLIAAFFKSPDGHTLKYWIYEDGFPKPCTEEEQEELLEQREHL